jgi:hypothetical protein
LTTKLYSIGSFFVRSRNLFVVVGDVLEGSIEAGMTVRVNLGSLNVATRVASMEVIDVDYLNKSYKGLAFGFDDPEELDFWACLKISWPTKRSNSNSHEVAGTHRRANPEVGG